MTYMRVVVETVTLVGNLNVSDVSRLIMRTQETEFVGKVVGEDEDCLLLAQGLSVNGYDNVARIPQSHIIEAEVIDGTKAECE